MLLWQKRVVLAARQRGFHLIDEELFPAIEEGLSSCRAGTLNLFLQHTSASLAISENCDASVRRDMEHFFNDLVAEDKPYYTHTYEGADDMPAHLKSVMMGVSLVIPITEGKLALGTWQGIYLNEHRDYAGRRTLIATVTGI